MRFGIVTDYFGIKTSLKDSLKLIARAGYKDVEIPGGHLIRDISAPPSASQMRKTFGGVKKLIADLGLTVWQVHGPYGANDLVATSEKERQKNIDVYKRWADCALFFGAKALIIHIGGRNDHCDTKDVRVIRDKNIDSLSQVASTIGNGGLKLALENLPSRCMEVPAAFNIFGNRISDLKELVKAISPAKTGICLDVGHANVEAIDIPLAIKEAGRDLTATHIQENNGVYDMHMFPFSLRARYSKVDWFAIFKAFKDINYPHPLIGECANTGGELPLDLACLYLKNQGRLIAAAMASA
ncbi:MAG: sugar phosphate isomerase/epimerase [Verrucomicrobiae bacterium]|nr:sugar phosphate isomerase/epimerase [Verrucomicrobiae bacterium]